MSGSRCWPSGVGTQMTMASQLAQPSKWWCAPSGVAADGDGVALAQAVEVGGGVEPPALHRLGDPLRADVLDVRLALRSASTLRGRRRSR